MIRQRQMIRLIHNLHTIQSRQLSSSLSPSLVYSNVPLASNTFSRSDNTDSSLNHINTTSTHACSTATTSTTNICSTCIIRRYNHHHDQQQRRTFSKQRNNKNRHNNNKKHKKKNNPISLNDEGWLPPSNTPYAQVIEKEMNQQQQEQQTVDAKSIYANHEDIASIADILSKASKAVDSGIINNKKDGKGSNSPSIEFNIDDLEMKDIEEIMGNNNNNNRATDPDQMNQIKAMMQEIDQLKNENGNEDVGNLIDFSPQELEKLKMELSSNQSMYSQEDFDQLLEAIDDEDENEDEEWEEMNEQQVMNEMLEESDMSLDDIDERLSNLKEGESILLSTSEEEDEDDSPILPSPSTTSNDDHNNDNTIDNDIWLSTRRAKLGQTTTQDAATNMLTPEQSKEAHKQDTSIPIIPKTLLSSTEITTCLEHLGATDVKVITPDEQTKEYLGWDAMIVATGMSYSHIRILADAIVSNLRKRGLAHMGVIGARYGAEGGRDTASSSRKKMKTVGRGKHQDDGWLAIDCRNYIVHVQDDVTRRAMNLEGLWGDGEEGQEGRELRKMNTDDEDAMDDYVATHPVPEEYAAKTMEFSQDFWADHGASSRIGLQVIDDKGGRWTPSTNKKKKKKNMKKRRKF